MASVLIHVGYPKAGSSYLQNWFAHHPAIYYKPIGLTGFFNTHDISRYAEDAGDIHECFVLSSEHMSIWKGSSDIVGLRGLAPYDIDAYRRKLSKTLRKIYPNSKVLVVTRGYTSLFPSFYSQYLAGGGTHTFDSLRKSIGEYFPVLYDYSTYISIFREEFGADNVLAMPYELMRENPHVFTAIIEEKMGIKNKYQFHTEKVNPALDKNILPAYRAFSNFLYSAIQPLPATARKKIYGAYIYHLDHYKPHPLLKALSKIMKREETMDGIDEAIASVKGRAEILRSEKLYQPYLKEYLL